MKTIEQRQIQQMAAPVLLNYLLLTIFETLDKSIVGHYSVQGFAVIGIAETPIYEITGACSSDMNAGLISIWLFSPLLPL